MTGVGLVTSLGYGCSRTWQRLLVGESALTLRQPFADLPSLPLGMVGQVPATLIGLLQPALTEAIADARIDLPLPDCGVVIGSSRSFQGTWEELARDWLAHHHAPNALIWPGSLPGMAASLTAQTIGSHGPVQAPMAACATGLWAIFQGWELIRRGQCDRVLVGAVEAPLTPLTLVGFERLGALARQGCYPFSDQRQGLVLGEGAAILLLEAETALHHRPGVEPYGRIVAAGLRADAHHLTAPDPQQTASRSALLACLAQAQWAPEQIDYVHAHGTGTILNDIHEAQLIRDVLPHQPPLSSTKGATGHTLGASGAIGMALGCLALRHQQLPPNPLTRGEAIYSGLITHSRPALIQRLLCLSFGFGGQNAVLAMEKC
ncbi:MAG: beta-ketoacyl-ACP synthase [Nodosilinea sp.]